MRLKNAAILILILSITALNLGLLMLNLAVRAKAEVAGKDNWLKTTTLGRPSDM